MPLKILAADDQLHMLRFMRQQLEPEGTRPAHPG